MQTKTMKDKEISDRLDGLRLGNYEIGKTTIGGGDVSLTVYQIYAAPFDEESITFNPTELLDFCKAVVERCDKKVLAQQAMV